MIMQPKSKWTKWLFVVALLGIIKFLILLYFTVSMHSSFGFKFASVWWRELLTTLLLLLLAFKALMQHSPFWLIFHLFYGPYVIFHPYGAITEITSSIGHTDWFAQVGMLNGVFTILYFVLAILTLIFWLIQSGVKKC